MTQLRVLGLQPFYGGSHKEFHDGWVQKSRHDWRTLSLPDRHWKWRMRHSSIHFAEQMIELNRNGLSWDVVFCTDMLNLAELKGMLPPSLASIPTVIYFHENQFVYPNRFDDPRDDHFRFTNFISAVAADQVWFNSAFNFESLKGELQKQMKRWPDFQPEKALASLDEKSQVQSPGIEPPRVDINAFLKQRIERQKNEDPLRIVWAARWEHDKRPDILLEVLSQLTQRNIDFEISVIGQSYRNIPQPLQEITEFFKPQIRRWGFQESREAYWQALAESDLFISTADHEFFGLSTVEAIAAGAMPLLPNRLSYPGLLELAFDEPEPRESALYDSTEDLVERIASFATRRQNGDLAFDLDAATRILAKINWQTRSKKMDQALESAISK